MERLNLEHPEYQAQSRMWQQYRDLYSGGEVMKANAYQYLIRRAKEPNDLYYERLGQAFYENYVGSIVDWYGATLFRREPLLSFEGGSERARRFYARFAEDCDFRGSSITAFLRRALIQALVAGRSYVLVDFPVPVTAAMSRAEEEASGQSRAYLVAYQAEEVINWSLDELGNYDWVMVRTEQWGEDSEGRLVKERCWTEYDKQRFRKYRQIAGSPMPALVAEGLHGLAGLNRVPLFELRIPEGLWLLNKAAGVQLEHYNKSNALAWSLQSGLFAMPIIYSEKPFDQIMGESYYLQLNKEDKCGWLEPEGRVHQIAVENLRRLKEEIYRVCFLMSQAGGPLTGAVVSGVSKQRDYTVTQEVLRTYGDLVKDLLKRVLHAVSLVRGDGIETDVAGLDEFDIGEFSAELSDAKELLGLGIPSDTLKKQIFKRLAQKYLCDVKQDVKNVILREIEAG